MDKETTIKNKAVKGVVWSTVQKFGSIAITFVANVILARLLTPADFGCVGMLMIFISISNTFIDGGFGSALIQKKNPTQKDYSTIFFWNLFLSVILYIILFIAAPAIAIFYNIPLLENVLKVQGFVLIINALGIVQANQLRKQLNFKRLSLIEIIAAILSLVFAIVLAFNGFGVWSLVIQQLCLSLFRTLLYWILSTWKPLLIFSFKSFKSLFNFGSFILLSNMFSTLSNEIQGLLVGKMFSPSLLGFYNQAYRLEGSLATMISGIIDQVTYPIMASLQDDKDKLISALKKFIQVPAFICAPLMGLAIVIAHPLILLIFGKQWLNCVPYFQILCTAGLAVCLQGAANNSISAIGKSKVLFKWTIIKRSITIVLCFMGIFVGGMYGMLWACVLGAWLVYIVNAYLVEKHIGYSLFNQIKDIMPFILLATIDAVVIYYLGNTIELSVFIKTVVQSILFALIYVIGSYVLHFDELKYIVKIVSKKK